MNKKKMIVAIGVLLIIGIGGLFFSRIQNTMKYDFAHFTTEDAMNFIAEENIQMPEGFEEIEGHEETVLNIIMNAYEFPDYSSGYSYTEMYDFESEIIEKVHSYME